MSLTLDADLNDDSWNKLPPEVLGLILSNLGRKDLLNARTVCHFWNDECPRVFKKTKIYQPISERGIGQFVRFATDSKSSKYVMPFHLTFTVNLEYPELVHLPLKYLNEEVKTLCSIFGSECVSKLTLIAHGRHGMECTAEGFKELRLIELFQLISPGLDEMDLSEFRTGIKPKTVTKGTEETGTEVAKMDIGLDVTFPNLTTMTCYSTNQDDVTRGPAPIFCSIIQNSPNLEHLKLTRGSNLKSWPIRYNKLKSLVILDEIVKPSGIWDKIRHSDSRPVLRKLQFKNNLVHNDQIVLYNIMNSVSDTLKSLCVNMVYDAMIEKPRIVTFPTLPHLENLILTCENNHHMDFLFLNHEDMNFFADTFPALKSINLALGFIFTNRDIRRADWEGEGQEILLEFPNLKKLTMNVSSNRTGYFGSTLRHLQKIFPNPSILYIGNDDLDEVNEHTVKKLLDLIIQSPWSKQIQEFGMEGFCQDYLGQLLNRLDFPPRLILENFEGELVFEELIKSTCRHFLGELKEDYANYAVASSSRAAPSYAIVLQRNNQPNSHRMTNITKVRLELEDKYRRRITSSRLTPVPNLKTLVKHFPHLRTIEISELLFRQNDRDLRREQIQEFTTLFPNVKINIF